MRTAAKALEITDSSVKIETGSGVEEIPADTVVLAGGSKAYNPLQEALEKKGVSFQVVGDAMTAAKAFDAVHQGFAAGRSI